MKIDRNNYEIFFIDYLDGNLPIEKIDELLDFLKNNEDLAEELKGLENIKLTAPESKKFQVTGLLKEDLDMPELFEEDCIRSMEGELTQLDKDIFNYRIKSDPKSKAIYELYQATVSEPDLLIAYPNKENLKKKVRTYRSIYWYSTAAVILLGLFFFLRDDNPNRHTGSIYVSETAIDKKTESTIPDIAVEENIEEKTTIIEEARPVKIEKIIKNEKKAVVIEQSVHVTEEPLALMESLKVSSIDQNVTENQYLLAKVEPPSDNIDKSFPKYLTLGELIAQKVSKLTSKDNVSKIRNQVLESIKVNSEEKFTYTTTVEGGIKSLEYQSKLLAFSIPLSTKGKD